ncbi:MAG: choice-of-anchor tandem repeat NxxGxxAF-containing protein [Planctomycetota bacterium]
MISGLRAQLRTLLWALPVGLFLNGGADAQVLSLGGRQVGGMEAYRRGAPIALTGTDGRYGPRLGPGVHFVSFQADAHLFANPALSQRGAVVFVGTIAGAGVDASKDTGVWVYRRGRLSLLAQEGEQAPGQPAGVVFARFGASQAGYAFDPTICESGAVAFKAGLRGGDVIEYPGGGSPNDDVIVTEVGGQLQILLREGVTVLPGYPGLLFGSSNAPPDDTEFFWGTPLMMTAEGGVVLRSRVKENTVNNNWDVIVDTLNGSLETFYRGNSDVPGYAPAKFWSSDWPLVTRSGALFHRPQNTDGGIVGFSVAVWSTRSGVYAPILKEGDALPGGGVVSDRPYLRSVNAAGRMVFVNGQDVFGFDGAIWTEGLVGVPVKIAKTLDPAPGTSGEAFSYLDQATVLLSDNGATVFKAPIAHSPHVNDTNDWGLWSNRSALTVNLELREGNPAPGLPGVVFSSFRAFFLNGRGNTAVLADLDDNTQGLWFGDSSGQYDFRFKTFDFTNQYDVLGDGSDLRIVTDILIGNDGSGSDAGGGGRRMPFNKTGNLAVRLKFLDGSEGIFLD